MTSSPHFSKCVPRVWSDGYHQSSIPFEGDAATDRIEQLPKSLSLCLLSERIVRHQVHKAELTAHR
jgi:hypothetical protein